MAASIDGAWIPMIHLWHYSISETLYRSLTEENSTKGWELVDPTLRCSMDNWRSLFSRDWWWLKPKEWLWYLTVFLSPYLGIPGFGVLQLAYVRGIQAPNYCERIFTAGTFLWDESCELFPRLPSPVSVFVPATYVSRSAARRVTTLHMLPSHPPPVF